METVLQELIKYFEQQLSLQRESNIKYTGEEAFFDALEICRNAFKTKEKKQLINAYNKGYRDRKLSIMRKIHFADHLEKKVAQALDDVEIEFIHESENKEQVLDFYLPFFDVFIEVKQFHTDRISKQMSSKDNVIAVQGTKSVNLLVTMLLRSKLKATVY